MASYRVQDRSGSVLEVHGKEQADYWVGLGYRLVTDEEKAEKPARKTAAKKATTRKSSSK